MILPMLRIAAVLTLVLAFLAGPAQASTDVNCNTHGRGPLTDAHVCVEFGWWRQADGTGLVIDYLRVRAMPQVAFEPSGLMVNGHSLDVIRNNGDRLWHRGDAECNIGQAGSHNWWMENNLRFGGSYFTVLYDYTARLDNAPDVTSTVGKTVG
jgi:hypothetical protein